MYSFVPWKLELMSPYHLASILNQAHLKHGNKTPDKHMYVHFYQTDSCLNHTSSWITITITGKQCHGATNKS